MYDLTGYWLQEDGEDEGRIWRMVKRLLRSIALVAGCIAVTSMVCLPLESRTQIQRLFPFHSHITLYVV